MVLRRLAKAKIAGSIPVSRFLKASREKYSREVFDFLGKANMIVKDGNIHSDLIKDIEALNMTQRNSSIIAIQNTKHPTKYLLYTDKGWGLKLFPNFATVSDDINNIKRKLSEELEINPDTIHAEHKTSANEIKFSTEHNEERSYHYTLYKAQIDNFNHDNDDTFTVAGKDYFWMTVPEMLEDPTLKNHNEVVIGLVRDNT